MDSTFINNLKGYIDGELHDAALYRELARVAPDNEDRTLFLEMAEDEQGHADSFKRIYRTVTGRNYNPVVEPPVLSGSYPDILRRRVLDESGDFRKYGEQYYYTNNNEPLKRTLYMAHNDENLHALHLLYMLSKYGART